MYKLPSSYNKPYSTLIKNAKSSKRGTCLVTELLLSCKGRYLGVICNYIFPKSHFKTLVIGAQSKLDMHFRTCSYLDK